MQEDKKIVKKNILKTRRWCSVPQCNFKGNNSLFHFPSNEILCKKWAVSCKIGKKITPNMYVCAAHFTDYDFYPKLNDTEYYNRKYRPRLKEGVVPTCNLPKGSCDKVLTKAEKEKKTAREARAKRRLQRYDEKQETKKLKIDPVNSTSAWSTNDISYEVENNLQENLFFNPPDDGDDNCEVCNPENVINGTENKSPEILAAEALLELSNISLEIEKDKPEESVTLSNKNKELCDLIAKKKKFTLFDLLKNDDDLSTFTGINFKLLNNLCEAVKQCEKKSVYYHSLGIRERIVLCLCRLKLDLTLKCLAVLFGIYRKTCSQIFVNTLHTLAFILQDAIYWPTKTEILCSMPICFQKFSETLAVMDCTEIPLERPKCLNCRLRVYSHYKGCETVKFLIAVSPSGLIMFISEPFGGRASDKAIFNFSNILPRFEPTRDGIMVDKGFAIDEECAASRVKLIIPPKLTNKKQFTKSNCIMTQEVASSRVHVERTIQRVKIFKIMNSKITHQIVPYMSEISKIICGIVNLSASIIDDDGYSNTQNAPLVKRKKIKKNRIL